LNYRRDIDGLRSLAILPVLFYHFGVWPFTGGFVGVDVFFVISGFLITGILVKEIEAGRFSLAGFYDRRFRRILPALVAVVLASLVAGYVLMFPADYESLGWQAAYSVFGLANFYFLWNTGYFDRAADLLPMLHMWSLAVEEQFYVIWPLLLALLFRFGRKAAIACLVLIVVVSLIASAIVVGEDRDMAFYMLHTRAWELALGALLVFAPAATPRLAHPASVVGIALIGYAVFAFTEKTTFPGLWALLPCVGAALLIWSGGGGIVNRLLSLPPFGGVGLISYSLYLWHWPVLVFWRIWANGVRPVGHEIAVLIAVSFVLAILSYFVIEQPFRQRRSWRPRITVPVGIGAAAVLAAVGAFIVQQGGIPGRLPAEAVRLASFVDYRREFSRYNCYFADDRGDLDKLSPECLAGETGKPNVLVYGDSHAHHLLKALRDTYPNIRFSELFGFACRPLLGTIGHPKCVELSRRAYTELIPDGGFDAVILSGQWRTADLSTLPASIEQLKRYVPRVIVLGQIVEYKDPLPMILAKEYLPRRHQSLNALRLYQQMKKVDTELAALSGGAEYYSVLDALCEGPRDCAVLAGDVPVQYDQSHLTYEGALVAVRNLQRAGLAFDRTRLTTMQQEPQASDSPASR